VEIVFFDVMGIYMVVYSRVFAYIINISSVVLFMVAVKINQLTVSSVLTGAGIALASLFGGIIAAAAVGFVVCMLGLAIRWYWMPTIGQAMYGLVAGVAALHIRNAVSDVQVCFFFSPPLFFYYLFHHGFIVFSPFFQILSPSCTTSSLDVTPSFLPTTWPNTPPSLVPR
jgi:hypothetical protein